eukprot:3068390-Pleurochrysis_carterae.AAC.1
MPFIEAAQRPHRCVKRSIWRMASVSKNWQPSLSSETPPRRMHPQRVVTTSDLSAAAGATQGPLRGGGSGSRLAPARSPGRAANSLNLRRASSSFHRTPQCAAPTIRSPPAQMVQKQQSSYVVILSIRSILQTRCHSEQRLLRRMQTCVEPTRFR